MNIAPRSGLGLSLIAASLLAACGGNDDDGLPQLTPATGATLASCTDLAGKVSVANTRITAASVVPAGTRKVAGTPIAEHCLVTGKMFERTSTVDGQAYAIGFEIRLPTNWSGRFLYQGNGGLDGAVVPATGDFGGGPLSNALKMGFAVISSDAGHLGSQGANFGVDPQARLDYGYQAAVKLTPMAKSVIQTAYGKAPDRSYFGGCSNGGRHTLVAAARLADQYDGFLAGAPGYNLPKAAVAQIYGAQQYATVATNPADLSTAYTQAERQLVSNAILAKCDALDGATDGLVQDTNACQAAFKLATDVPTCSGARDGSCLSAAQKTAIGNIATGARTSNGTAIYASFPYDPGVIGSGTTFWEFTAPLALDSGAAGIVFGVPPADPATFNGPAFALSASVDDLANKIVATNGVYTESAMSFMTPPNPTNLSTLKNRGAKVMVYHGASDPVFSVNDTTAWVEGLNAANGGDASDFARVYRVPGMNHCSGGPSTDQFDMLQPLVDWVEKGIAPDSVIASARGVGNAGGVNAELPAGWSATRTRPLCSYPKVAKYKGTGSIEEAANFSCQ
ncbi:MAG: esterase [Rhizobacter sp.]|nr:esterase [Rhizobacter sp.]